MAGKPSPELEHVFAAVERAGFKVDRWKHEFQCPAHGGKDDLNAEANVSDDGKVLLRCWSHKCTAEQIVAAIGLTMADLFPPDAGDPTHHEPRFSHFDYQDEAGRVVYQTVRRVPGFGDKKKSIWQQRPDGHDGWAKNMKGVTALPYRLPELVASSGLVVIAEGEPCVDTLGRLGFTATCNHGGAEKWVPELNHWLAGRDVLVMPDNDEPGLRHAEAVARSLHGIVARLRVLDPLPGVGPKGDVVDFVAAGGTADELRRLIEAAPTWEPRAQGVINRNGHLGPSKDTGAGEPHPNNSYELSQGKTGEDRARRLDVEPFPVEVFPPKVMRLITEGAAAVGCPVDLVAVPFLAYASAALGNRATLSIKRSYRQRPALWTIVVAPSGKMKTPADRVARLPLDGLQRIAAATYDKELAEYAEAIELGQPVRKPHLVNYYTTDATVEALAPMLKLAPGLVVARGEIVGLVKGMDAYRSGRGGDRQRYLELWDGSPLKIDRKGADTIFVPDPVLSIAGGCQPAVLPQLADEATQHDGFVPRFLWAYPDVPDGAWTWDDVEDATIEAVTRLLSTLRAMEPVEVGLSDKAKELWATWATHNMKATAAAGGMAASVTAKLEVQVSRLALLLHCLWHPQRAGLAVSAETVARATLLGDYFRSHANRVLLHFDATATRCGATMVERTWLALLKDGGGWISKTELNRRLGNNYPASELDAALVTLGDQGRAESRKEPGPTKPTEFWRGVASQDNSFEFSQNGTEANALAEETELQSPPPSLSTGLEGPSRPSYHWSTQP